MPTVTIPDKICPHCNEDKWYLRKYKNGNIQYTCSKLKNEKGLDYRKKNEEKVKISNKNSKKKYIKNNPDYYKNYYSRNKDSVKKIKAKWRENNRTSINEKNKKIRDDLKDHYVIHILCKNNALLKKSDIDIDLINLNKKQILLKRKIYEQKGN